MTGRFGRGVLNLP